MKCRNPCPELTTPLFRVKHDDAASLRLRFAPATPAVGPGLRLANASVQAIPSAGRKATRRAVPGYVADAGDIQRTCRR